MDIEKWPYVLTVYIIVYVLTQNELKIIRQVAIIQPTSETTSAAASVMLSRKNLASTQMERFGWHMVSSKPNADAPTS